MSLWSRVRSFFVQDAKPLPLVVRKADGWKNAYTGASTAFDKLMHGHFEYEPLDRFTLEQLYYGNDIARKIIDHIVYDSMREGYELKGIDPEDQKTLRARAKEMQIDEKVQNALKWARLYGGTGLLLGVQDFKPMIEPLDPEGAFDFTYVRAVDRRYAFSVFWDENIFSTDYGNPAIWLVGAYSGPFAYCHTSRFIPIRGTSTDEVTKRRLQGWGFPTLQPVYDVLRGLGQAEHAAIQVLVDMNLDVFKLQGLVAAVAADQQQVVADRMMQVDMRKSAGKSILLDKDGEDMERLAGNVPAGVSQILEHLLYRISCASDMPVSVLFGRAPQGMNATGDMDVRLWYDRVKAFQNDVVKPILMRIYKAMCLSEGVTCEDLEIEFTSLYQMTPSEQADVYSKMATADGLYLGEGVLTPEEVAKSRFKPNGFNLIVEIDPDLPREKPLDPALDPEVQGPLKEQDADLAKEQAKAAPPGDSAAKSQPFGGK
jgi:phage-related protein (TIGR01555 family)